MIRAQLISLACLFVSWLQAGEDGKMHRQVSRAELRTCPRSGALACDVLLVGPTCVAICRHVRLAVKKMLMKAVPRLPGTDAC